MTSWRRPDVVIQDSGLLSTVHAGALQTAALDRCEWLRRMAALRGYSQTSIPNLRGMKAKGLSWA
jgi:hypothetical protein